MKAFQSEIKKKMHTWDLFNLFWWQLGRESTCSCLVTINQCLLCSILAAKNRGEGSDMVSLRLLFLRSLGIDNLNRCCWWWISRWRNRLGHSDYKDQSQQQNQRWWWWEREGKSGSSVHIGFWALLHLILFMNRKKVTAEY